MELKGRNEDVIPGSPGDACAKPDPTEAIETAGPHAFVLHFRSLDTPQTGSPALLCSYSPTNFASDVAFDKYQHDTQRSIMTISSAVSSNAANLPFPEPFPDRHGCKYFLTIQPTVTLSSSNFVLEVKYRSLSTIGT
jgi:hypothetical protein